MHNERTRGEIYNNSRFKRLIDILVGLIGLPPALVAIGIVGVAIKLEDGGEIFFKQERIGKNGRQFSIYKLRTFGNGERTRLGKVIRPLAIDEFPQVLSILNGDMSIFGVRAISKSDFDELMRWQQNYPEIFDEAFIELWKQKYISARPGGLSLATARAQSVFYRGYQNPKGVRTKMEHDIYQADNESLEMDAQILAAIIAKALHLK